MCVCMHVCTYVCMCGLCAEACFGITMEEMELCECICLCVCVCMYVCVYVWVMFRSLLLGSRWKRWNFVSVSVYVCVCMHMYVSTYTHIHTCIHTAPAESWHTKIRKFQMLCKGKLLGELYAYIHTYSPSRVVASENPQVSNAAQREAPR
jgi:hypothetical protein